MKRTIIAVVVVLSVGGAGFRSISRENTSNGQLNADKAGQAKLLSDLSSKEHTGWD